MSRQILQLILLDKAMANYLRTIAPCVFLLALAGQAPLPSDTKAADFCSRLAGNIGIDRPAASDGLTTWTANALNFGQRFIFGGSAATGVGVEPVEPETVEDYRRLRDMCMPGKGSAVCRLVGPVEFELVWKGSKVVTPMAAGERATVTVKGTRTTCQSEAPVAPG
jgi:hypothetical protein